MYIRLGNLNLVRKENNQSDFTILSSVVNSTMSYEKPILVHTVEELRIWFGTGHDFLEELLTSGFTLYLVGPLVNESSENKRIVSGLEELPKTWEENVIYKLLDGTEYTSYIDKTVRGKAFVYKFPEDMQYNIEYTLPSGQTKIIYEDFGLVKVNDLPKKKDIENRDTLFLGINPEYTTPELGADKQYRIIPDTENINLEALENSLESYAFKLNIPNSIKESDYIIIDGNLLAFGNQVNIKSKYYTHQYYVNKNYESIVNRLELLGFKVDNDILYSSKPLKATYFSSFGQDSITPLQQETQNFLSKFQDVDIKFWSKTVGSFGEDGKITVKITEDYIEISRFGYSEIIEYPTEDKINSVSKLIYCSTNLDFKDWPKGIWTMDGSHKLTTTDKDYGLNLLLDSEDIYPDFLCIDNLNDYPKLDWKDVLEKVKELETQVLIENNKDDYKGNYTKDGENRLVYFFGKAGNRPGYYPFLLGLFNETYSIKTDSFYYTSDIPKDLEQYKSNYLTDNGLFYYYDKYFDEGTSSIFMRFILSKVFRELQKNKWSFVSERMAGNQITNIKTCLSNIERSFGIVRNLSLEECEFDYTNNKINLTVNTSISDLVKSNITMDITINYSKLN